jgi:hypothetical protein
MHTDTHTPPTPREIHNEPWRLLATLPSTNWKVAVGTVLVLSTALQLYALQWSGRDARVVVALWDSWLIFVGSYVGISAAQYAWKRKTYDPTGPEAQRSAASEPGAAAEAVRVRGAQMDMARATAEHGIPVVPAPVVAAPLATLAPAAPVIAPAVATDPPRVVPGTVGDPRTMPGAVIPGEGD